MYERILWRIREAIVALEKTITITCCECVSVTLVIHHAVRMRRIILSPVSCLALPHSSTLSHKRHDFRSRAIGRKMCVLIFCATTVSNISHSKKNQARYCHKCT